MSHADFKAWALKHYINNGRVLEKFVPGGPIDWNCKWGAVYMRKSEGSDSFDEMVCRRTKEIIKMPRNMKLDVDSVPEQWTLANNTSLAAVQLVNELAGECFSLCKFFKKQAQIVMFLDWAKLHFQEFSKQHHTCCLKDSWKNWRKNMCLT
eukprot:7959230-Lingulodinium_polyedra.AAC.1